MAADQVPAAVPDQRTLALANTYIISIARMLNDFSASCEVSLSKVQTSLQAAEARLSLLEAQLVGAAADNVADRTANPPSNGLHEPSSPTESAEATHGDEGAGAASPWRSRVGTTAADAAPGDAAATGEGGTIEQHEADEWLSPSKEVADDWALQE